MSEPLYIRPPYLSLRQVASIRESYRHHQDGSVRFGLCLWWDGDGKPLTKPLKDSRHFGLLTIAYWGGRPLPEASWDWRDGDGGAASGVYNITSIAIRDGLLTITGTADLKGTMPYSMEVPIDGDADPMEMRFVPLDRPEDKPRELKQMRLEVWA